MASLPSRGQEYVVSLKPCGRGMVLETLRYAGRGQSRASSYFRDIGDAKPDPDLLDLAETLIEKKSERLRRQGVRKPIHRGAEDADRREAEEKGQAGSSRTTSPMETPKGSNVIDLMAALKKSLGDDKKTAPKKRGLLHARPQPSLLRGARRKRPLRSGPRAGVGARPWRAASSTSKPTIASATFRRPGSRWRPHAQGNGQSAWSFRSMTPRTGCAELQARARRGAEKLGGAQGTLARPRTTNALRCEPRIIRSITGNSKGSLPRANMAAAR